jgi:hypothetical protein
METSSTATSTPTVKRKWHFTSYLAGTLVLCVGILFNVGIDFSSGIGICEFHFGCPWVYGRIEASEFHEDTLSKSQPWTNWFRVDQIEVFNGWLLLGNIGVVCSAAGGSAYLFQRRLDRLKHWCRFTLSDWLWFCVLISLCVPFHAWLYHDNLVEAKLIDYLDNDLYLAEHSETVFGNASQVSFPLCSNVPYDFFWELFGIPADYRPKRIRILTLDNFAISNEWSETNSSRSTKELPLDLFKQMTKLSALKEISLENTQLTLTATHSQQKHIITTTFPIGAFRELKQCRNLDNLLFEVTGEALQAEHVQELAELPAFKSLIIDNAQPHITDHIGQFQALDWLSVENSKLNETALEQIMQLPHLKNLFLINCIGIAPEEWKILGRMQQLETLDIRGNAINATELQKYFTDNLNNTTVQIQVSQPNVPTDKSSEE